MRFVTAGGPVMLFLNNINPDQSRMPPYKPWRGLPPVRWGLPAPCPEERKARKATFDTVFAPLIHCRPRARDPRADPFPPKKPSEQARCPGARSRAPRNRLLRFAKVFVVAGGAISYGKAALGTGCVCVCV